MQNSESGIPLLTEVLVPVYGVDLPERRSVPRPPPAEPASADPAPQARHAWPDMRAPAGWPVAAGEAAAPHPGAMHDTPAGDARDDASAEPGARAIVQAGAETAAETHAGAGAHAATQTGMEDAEAAHTSHGAASTAIAGTAARGILQVRPEIDSQPAIDAPAAAPAGLDPATLARIEQDLSKAVLDRLLGNLDEVLEARIRDQLADVLQTAVDGLACDLRAGLKQALGESISLAVAAEIKNMQISEIEKSL